ncbi:MAG: T9SS type A sorting domain-containing protein [Bacteroidales bacterium]|nr:T9SS type A sorting domain-containing protein [Bacteroidales bacterium]
MKTNFTLLIFSFIICMSIPFQLKAQGENTQQDKENYWILEDFNQFPIEEEWNILQKNYPTYPNNIDLTTLYASVEQGFDCAYGQNALRIRGLEENGSAEFKVPNASWIRIYITGKQKAADRGVIISINGKEEFREEGFDRYQCIEFAKKIDSQEEVTVKITAADETKKDPIVLYYVEVQKYGKDIPKPEPPTPNYDAYWIYEDFKEMAEELDYNTSKSYKTLPNNLELVTDSANIELGEGCSGGGGRKNLRIRGKQYAGGKVEFTVPDAKSVSINLTGKSIALDRIIYVYKNDQLVETFTGLDRTTCVEFLDEEGSAVPVKYRIEGGSNTDKPVAITSIYVEKYDYTGMDIIEKNEDPVFVYPNPAKEKISFREKAVAASIYELNGRLVAKTENTTEMNVTHLNSGSYIIKIMTSSGVVTQKLIIE